MLFNSWAFVLLVVCVFPLYYWRPVKRAQIHILLAASLVFYGYHQPKLLLLLVYSISINALASYFVTFGRAQRRFWWALLGVGTNLGVLAFFKYSGLFYRTLFRPTAGDRIGEFLLALPLPIGISFFTFQGISLVVDAYRSARSPEPSITLDRRFSVHFVRISFFKAFFPQLVAGPIVKAHEFLPQIAPKTLRDIDWPCVLHDLLLGYFLKMVVADHLKEFTYWIAYPYFLNWSTLTLLGLLFGYSMQIFADFAGYSLIALGLGGLFGYRLPINFDFPYIAESFSEFWQRWHISLSSFLRQYLYIPLGGNRHGALRTYLNLFIVMFLGGLWHGAAWSYAVWGSAHGLLLAVERLVQGSRPRRATSFAARALKATLVFTCVTLCWLLFQLTDFHQALLFMHSLATQRSLATNYYLLFNIGIYSVPVLVYHAHYLWRRSHESRGALVETLVLGGLLSLIILNSGSPGAFIYFQF
ncbi:MAG TPA: MBOAT family O-acyltransferase [Polyangia bacterium]|nr:MBOAT family O-acyltransferase [Polyangia bacterium]